MDVQELLSKAVDAVSVRRAFGTAYEKDGCLVIPVAVVGGGGGGGQSEPGPVGQEVSPVSPTPGEAATARRKDAGGGFGSVVWPLGVYVVKDGDVRWVPAIDATRLIVAGAVIVRSLLRARQRRLGSGT